MELKPLPSSNGWKEAKEWRWIGFEHKKHVRRHPITRQTIVVHWSPANKTASAFLDKDWSVTVGLQRTGVRYGDTSTRDTGKRVQRYHSGMPSTGVQQCKGRWVQGHTGARPRPRLALERREAAAIQAWKRRGSWRGLWTPRDPLYALAPFQYLRASGNWEDRGDKGDKGDKGGDWACSAASAVDLEGSM